MPRERVLQIILEVVCLVVLTPYLVHVWISHKMALAYKPKPTAAELKFQDSFKAGLQREQAGQCESAIPQFREAEMFAAKMPDDGKYADMADAEQHIAGCNALLGHGDDTENARHRLAGILIDEGVSLDRRGQWDDAAAKLEEAERDVLQLSRPDENYLHMARAALVDAYWRRGRVEEAESVYARMATSVHQTKNGYQSDVGDTYLDIAQIQSSHDDWAGAQQSLQQAIQNYDDAIRSYGDSFTRGARTSKYVAEYWLETAYWRQKNADMALSTAESEFQELGGTSSNETGLSRQIATLALSVATISQNRDAVAQWRQRLDALPSFGCPVSQAGPISTVDLRCAIPQAEEAARARGQAAP